MSDPRPSSSTDAGPAEDGPPTVLFVCVHNAGRSQMAAGYLQHLAGDRVQVLSAGSAPAEGINPVAVAATYVGASTEGPAEVTTRIVRHGTLTTVAADLTQDGAPRITALATFSDLARLTDEVGTTAVAPVLPPPEECVATSDGPPEFLRTAPLVERFEMRLTPRSVGWALGEPSRTGVLEGWFRLPGREPDPLMLLLACDAMPPVTFDLGRPGWAPTVQLTTHVRAVPAPGWLALRQSTSNLAGGFFEEDCEIWDSAGRLVAQSRQLALIPSGR